MELELEDANGVVIAELKPGSAFIATVDAALDLIGNCGYLGATHVLIHKNSLAEDFFNLETRLAGDILQKFSNYQLRLAIVGDFSAYNSQSLRDFIFESNITGHIIFVGSVDEAKHQWVRTA